MATTKAAGRKSAAKKAAGKSAAKRGAKTAAKKTAAKRTAKSAGNYTDPALRERLKAKVVAGTKGGRAGQWSARKAQLLAHEYEAHGGGYTGAKTETQQHLDEWTHEEWRTADGAPARRGKTTARYLPKKAWEKLTPAERRATDKKKRSASKTGKQFVANTGPAAAARRDATAHEGGASKGATKRAAKSASKRATKRAAKSASKRATKRPAARKAAAKKAPARKAPARKAAGRKAAAKRAGRG